MPQEVLAGLVGRSTDWLSKVENGRIELDRLSVIKVIAVELGVPLGDLLGEPDVLQPPRISGTLAVPALREALLNYRQLSPLLPAAGSNEVPVVEQLRVEVAEVWNAYQESRYKFVIARLPLLIRSAQAAASGHEGKAKDQALCLLALTYQSAAVLLTKLGEADLAWVAAERGFNAAHAGGEVVVIGSLFRSLTHALLSSGRYREAKQLSVDAAEFLRPGLPGASPTYLSVYGTLFLTGAIAAAREGDRASATALLDEADEAARQLGRDGNYLWTAFGPTNVAIHRVATASGLGDVQVAIDLSSGIDTFGLPTERRVRHALESARALSARNRTDDALATLLDAEQIAPEQVRNHAISRQLVQTWMRRGRGRPSFQLAGLARRVRVVR